MTIRTRTVLALVGACVFAALVATPSQVATRSGGGTLSLNLPLKGTNHYNCNASWSVKITGADANSTISFIEWRANETGVDHSWNGDIGTTNGAGNFTWNTTAPSNYGVYVAEVFVNGVPSNTIWYVAHC